MQNTGDPAFSGQVMVEAPGTAPGSDRFITLTVYRNSRQAGTYLYRRYGRYLEPRSTNRQDEIVTGPSTALRSIVWHRRPQVRLWILPVAAILTFEAETALAEGSSGFEAREACAATKKKTGDNPGNIRLVPGRNYPLLGRNATPGTHFRIKVRGAPVTEERWVKMTCGVVTGRDAQRQRAVPTRREKATSSGSDLQSNSIEHVLALTWHPGFCLMEPDRRECRSLTPDRFAASHFVLHGLWPDDLDDRRAFPCYCGTGQPLSCRERRPTDRSVRVSDGIYAQLREAMPGVQSGLHRYQWTKHGSCYERDRTDSDKGADPDEYFDEALNLLEQVNRSAVRDVFVEAAGRVLPATRIQKAFDQAFGRGAGRRVQILCQARQGRQIIVELRIALGSTITPHTDISDLIADAPANDERASKRSCAAGLVVSAGG